MIEAAVADPTMPEFDQQQAVDELKQYLWAGTETTALTLAWALYETAKHPEAAERIRKEGEAVYGDREPTAADYSALAYTRAVIQETMRLYPPIWMLIRVATKPDVIDGKEIRAGDRVALFAYGAHHNPKFWEAPEEFRPERWIGRRRQEAHALYLPAVRRRQARLHRRRHEPGGEHAGAVDPAAPLPARVRRHRAARHQRHRDADAQGRPAVPDQGTVIVRVKRYVPEPADTTQTMRRRPA